MDTLSPPFPPCLSPIFEVDTSAVPGLTWVYFTVCPKTPRCDLLLSSLPASTPTPLATMRSPSLSTTPPAMSASELSAAQSTAMEFKQMDAGPSTDKLGQAGTPNRSRSKACLHCRRRKMRCDGAKPACFQCKRADRANECEYDDGTTKTVTQLLYEKLHRLEKRLRELQAQNPNHSAAGGNRRSVTSTAGRHTVGHARSYSDSISSRPPSSAGSSTSFHAPTQFVSASSFATVPSMVLGERSAQFDIGSSEEHFQFPSQFESNPSRVYSGQGNTSTPSLAYGFDCQTRSNFSGYDWVTQGTYDAMVPHDPTDFRSPDESPLSLGGDEPSPALSQYLIECFLPHAQQVGFTPRAPFVAASLPPALLHAILLWGVHFASDKSLNNLQEQFLRRAVAALPELLHQHDGGPVGNLLVAIQASTVLATYFFAQGRSIEGAYHANTATGLVLCTGLHTTRLSPSRSHPSSPLRDSVVPEDYRDTPGCSGNGLDLLPAPRSRNESVERLYTFWNAFVMERTWAAACGLPAPGWRSSGSPSFKGPIANGANTNGRTVITASWPAEYSDDAHRRSYSPPGHMSVGQRQYSPPLAQSAPHGATVDDFLVGIDPTATNSPIELRVKAAALFEAAARLADEQEPASTYNTCPYTPQLATLQRTISIFTKHLPPIPSASDRDFPHSSCFETSSIFVTHSMAQASVIRAHYTLAERAYELCRLNGNVDATAMMYHNEPEIKGVQDVFERLYAYETVNSQFGMDNVRLQDPTLQHMNDNASASMAVAALDKCLVAATEIARIVSCLAQNDYTFLEPVVGSCWMLAALVILREVDRINAQQAARGRSADVSTNQFDEKFDLMSKLDSIVGALRSLGRVFPIVDTQAQKISTMLASQTQRTTV